MTNGDKRIILCCFVFLVYLTAYLVMKCTPSPVSVQPARPVHELREGIAGKTDSQVGVGSPSLLGTDSSIAPGRKHEIKQPDSARTDAARSVHEPVSLNAWVSGAAVEKQTFPVALDGTPIAKHKRCSKSTAFKAAKKRIPGSKSFFGGGHDGTVCPDDAWMPVFRQLEPRKHFRFVNIGMNKGFGVAMVLNAWTKNSHIDFKSWHRALMRAISSSHGGKAGDFRDTSDGIPPMCGNCRDCISPPVSEALREFHKKYAHFSASLQRLQQDHGAALRAEWGPVSVLGVELNPSTADVVRKVVNDLRLSPQVQVLNAAVSDSRDDMMLPYCSMGSEVCAAEPLVNNPALIRVPGSTVDDLVRNWTGGLETIDYLEIDTEGHDPVVLKGAERLLENKQIRILRFEYHSKGAWLKHSLSSIISQLDLKGYECYYGGQSRLWRLTNCMDAIFESRKPFRNVLCVQRRDPFYDVFELFEACHLDYALCAGAPA